MSIDCKKGSPSPLRWRVAMETTYIRPSDRTEAAAVRISLLSADGSEPAHVECVHPAMLDSGDGRRERMECSFSLADSMAELKGTSS